MKSLLPKLVLIFLLLTGPAAIAQVKFTAVLSPDQISKDEYTQLRLLVENAREVQQISPPALNNFIIISGPNQESGMSMVNGDVTKYVAISFIIKPKGPGTFIIPSAIARADGSVFRSSPVTLKVSNTVSGNSNTGVNGFMSPFNGIDPFAEPVQRSNYQDYILHKGENAMDKIRKNMMVKVETDKSSCYVGEPVIATYKLYTRLKSESGMTKNPSFNGFSVIDLQQPDNSSYRTEKVNGREYNVYIIRKAQLYPLQPGNIELEAAEIDNRVHFIKEEYIKKQQDIGGDLFRDFADAAVPPEGVEDYSITLQSKPLAVTVKPLPDLNKPVDFKGAVGNFSIDASLSKNNFTTDDACDLSLVISGSGNLQLVTAPEITWPDGIEGFEPKVSDDLNKLTVPVSGRKIIKYPFTVSKAGKYSIPVISFSYFDLQTLQYRTVTTRPLLCTVLNGTGKGKETQAENKSGTESLLNRFFSNRWRVVGVLALGILLGIFFWYRGELKKDRKTVTAVIPGADEHIIVNNESMEAEMARLEDPLAPALLHLKNNEPAAFYSALNEALRSYLARKLDIPPEELNKKTITEQLDKKGIRNDIALQLQRLLDEVEWQLYTPFSENEKMREMYDRADGLILLLKGYKF